MASVFTKIIRGDIPCYKIAENDQFFAFLDIFPLVAGHVLIVPKIEVDRFFDVPDEYLASWFQFATPIAKAIEAAFSCNRCGMAVVGLEVPHAHMHLVPVNSADDLNFTKPKVRMSDSELLQVQNKILNHLL